MSKKKQKDNGTSETKVSNPTESMAKPVVNNGKWYIVGVLLLTTLVFSSSIQNDFVNWDDEKNIYENELIKTLSKENFWENTAKIFTTPTIGNYNPLSILSLGIDKLIYGLDKPYGFHLTNLILHLLCTFLVYKIVIGLNLNWLVAIFTALFFGLHPLRVESVAWITERKDVLFGFFYLFALLLYIRHRSRISKKSYSILILFLFILSLFSKIQAVILPISMLLVDYYFTGSINWKQIFAKSHLFIFSLIFGIIGLLFLKEEGSLNSASDLNFSWYHRPFIGMFSLVIYLIKSVIPFRMSPLYPYPAEPLWYFYISILILPVLGYTIWHFYKKDNRLVVFGLLFFLANIVMLLQVLGAGQGYLADRFTYIPYIGLFVIFSNYLYNSLTTSKAKYIKIGLTLLFAAFSIISYNQNKIWKNSETLWTHVIKYYPNTSTPFGNRANFRRDNKDLLGALSDYNEVIRLEPSAQTYNSRAKLYFDNFDQPDSLKKALLDYTKAIELTPKDAEFHANRGGTYARLGDFENALKDCTTAIELNPKFANAYLNRSVIYHRKNELQLALSDIMKYLNLRPYNADIWYEACRTNILLNNYPEAEKMINKAMAVEPSKGLYFYQRALLYFNTQRLDLAKNDVIKAISLGYKEIDPTVKIRLGL